KETGIIEELYAADRRRNHEPWAEGRVNVLWDLTLYDAARSQERLTLFLNTSVRNVDLDHDRICRVHAVEWGSPREIRLDANLFIDATGTGTLGYLAGAEYRSDREGRDVYGELLAP